MRVAFVRREISGRVIDMLYTPEVDNSFVHPFDTGSFDLNPEKYEVIAVDAEALYLKYRESGMDTIRKTFEMFFTVGGPSSVPGLHGIPRAGVQERELLPKR